MRFVILSLCLTLSACDWIGRQADAVGSIMPVIGERCEHWQCMTDDGEAISDAYKEQDRLREEKEKAAAEAAMQKAGANTGPKPLLAPDAQ